MNHFRLNGVEIQLIHATSGRIRLKAIAPSKTVLIMLAKQLERLTRVYEVECKTTTGSLIIWFNEDRSTGEELLASLGQSLELSIASTPSPQSCSKIPAVLPQKIATTSERGRVRTGVLKGLKGGVLKCCLAIFARYSLSELAEHSRVNKILQSSPTRKSVWQKLKAISN